MCDVAPHKLRIQLAPLQGFTEAPFRNALEECFGGVDVFYTPFIRIEHGEVRKRSLRDALPEVNKVSCIVPQIIASTYDEAQILINALSEQGHQRVDINMGCPFPALALRGKGSGILSQPDKVAEVLRVVRENPSIRFSVKMRLGYEQPDECLALLPILNDIDLVQVAVHARVGKQQYKGVCNLQAFVEFAEGCRHPLYYNGDVCTLQDIERLHAQFPFIEGVMMGRGLLAHPWVAYEYASGIPLLDGKRKECMRTFHAHLFDYYAQHLEGGETQLLQKMKTFWEYLMPETDRKLLKRIHKTHCIADYTAAVHQIFL